MAVPENIRSVSRPVNTIVVDTGRNGLKRYAVRERSYVKYVQGGNPQPRNGRIIGHIVNDRYVPVTEDLNANKFVRLGNIPEELKMIGEFCLWKYERIGDRDAKIPYNPNNVLTRAATNKPETFMNYSGAIEVLKAHEEEFEGLGIRIAGDFIGIDIDKVEFNEHGEPTGKAREIVDALDSYTEISPSGKGLRIFCKAAALEYDRLKYYFMHNNVEIYIPGYTNRYLTVTGNVLKKKRNLADRSEELQDILDKFMLRKR